MAWKELAPSEGYHVGLRLGGKKSAGLSIAMTRVGAEKGLFDAYEYRRSFYDRLVPLFLESQDHGVLDFGRKDVFLLPNRRFRWNSLRSLCRAW
jgi:hypothetical protein